MKLEGNDIIEYMQSDLGSELHTVSNEGVLEETSIVELTKLENHLQD